MYDLRIEGGNNDKWGNAPKNTKPTVKKNDFDFYEEVKKLSKAKESKSTEHVEKRFEPGENKEISELPKPAGIMPDSTHKIGDADKKIELTPELIESIRKGTSGIMPLKLENGSKLDPNIKENNEPGENKEISELPKPAGIMPDSTHKIGDADKKIELTPELIESLRKGASGIMPLKLENGSKLDSNVKENKDSQLSPDNLKSFVESAKYFVAQKFRVESDNQ